MKKTALVAMMMIGFVPSAYASPDLVAQLVAKVKKASARQESPPQQHSPARQDKVRVKITKNTFTQMPDGSYKFVTSDVCTSDGTFNVYNDATPISDIELGNDDWARMSCASTYGGKTVEVGIGGALVTGQAKIFDAPQDIKALVSFLYIGTFGETTMQLLNATASATGDVHANSLIANIQPTDIMTTCSSESTSPSPEPQPQPTPAVKPRAETCSTSMNEYFIATIEIKD